jgi:hypothetical protein
MNALDVTTTIDNEDEQEEGVTRNVMEQVEDNGNWDFDDDDDDIIFNDDANENIHIKSEPENMATIDRIPHPPPPPQQQQQYAPSHQTTTHSNACIDDNYGEEEEDNIDNPPPIISNEEEGEGGKVVLSCDNTTNYWDFDELEDDDIFNDENNDIGMETLAAAMVHLPPPHLPPTLTHPSPNPPPPPPPAHLITQLPATTILSSHIAHRTRSANNNKTSLSKMKMVSHLPLPIYNNNNSPVEERIYSVCYRHTWNHYMTVHFIHDYIPS